jgi:hypothetical protein
MAKALITLLIFVSAALQAATVEFVAPAEGASIGGSEVEIKVVFTTTADKPITKLQVFLDGVFITERPWESAESKGECSFTWDTLRTPNGPHKVDIQVFSKDEYLAMGSLTVTVANKVPDMTPPTIAIMSPREGEAVSGTITIVVEASDDGTTEPFVSIYIDGSLRAVKNHGPYTYVWDTTTGGDRSYTIRAIAVDEAGNKAEAKPVKPIVRNPKKQVPITERDYRP